MSARLLSAWPSLLLPLLGAGIVPIGPVPPGEHVDSTWEVLIVGGLLGCFCGLIFGLITSQVVRYISFLMGRHVPAAGWAVFSMVAGAVLFAWLAVSMQQ